MMPGTFHFSSKKERSMADANHLKILSKGTLVWNEWRARRADVIPDLSNADLSETDFRGIRFDAANLTGADLSRSLLVRAYCNGTNLVNAQLGDAVLGHANLNGADLTRACLKGARLDEAILNVANLTETDLRMADLMGADLSEAKLHGADMTDAVLGFTTFGDVDLSEVRGLEGARHEGPSTIGIDTIYRSHGKIPELFLRGAGVPDDFITYMKSLVGTSVEYYSCFISYSGRDQCFVERLYSDLQTKGVRCWFAPRDAKAGDKLYEQIDQAIRMHDRVLLVLSPSSMNSDWVKHEISRARRRERQERKRVLFPVSLVSFDILKKWECFDADAKKDSAQEIREYLIPDFTKWKNHDSYQKALGKLLRDLRGPRTNKPPVF